jgi:Tol biopolymer transport system component
MRAPLDNRFSDAFMRYTPDGSKLTIWGRTWPGPVAPGLWILPADASAPYEVTGTPQDLSTNLPPRFDWLPDNRHVVAALERASVQGAHLWVLNPETGQTIPLTTGAGTENTPAVSPDGRRIAYASQDVNFDLVEIPVDGSPVRPLLATSRNEMEPGWSPTNPEYAFVTDRTGRYEIWLRSRDGSWERSLVTQDDFSDQPTYTFRLPAFSPDGQKIAFERVTADGPWICVVTRAGSSPVQIIRGAYSPAWSPDGEWIAVLRPIPGHWSLEKVRAGTPSVPVVLHEVTGIDHPQWSPDNRWIASNTAQGLSLIAPEGNVSRILDEGPWIVYGWSSDGSSLYGVKQSDDSQRLILVSADIASGRLKVLNDALAPVPPVNAPIKGFSRISDNSFATSLVRVRSDLWLIDGLLQQGSLIDRLWPRNALAAWRNQNNPRSP